MKFTIHWGLWLLIGGAWCFETHSHVAAQNRPAVSTAKDPVEAAHLEFSLNPEELDALRDQTWTLLLKNGKKEEDATLREFLRGKQLRDRFRSIEYIASGKKSSRKLPSEQVFQLEQGETIYEVAFLPTQKYHVLIDVKKRNAAVAEKLAASGQRFWEPLSAEDQQKYVDEGKELLAKAVAHFPTLPLQLHETQYFLFLSDMPAAQVKPYIQQLDKMNEALGQSFGFPPGHNVWRGKAVVAVFVTEAAFAEFERAIMDNPASSGAQGLCHQVSDGRVVVACYRGDSPEFLGAVLVHETAHGYMHRYKSTTHIPVWLNEGIADWIAGVAVPSSPEISRRQQEAAGLLKQSGTFGKQFFEADRLERWQYGAGSAMVQQMIQANPQLFQLFFNGIKEGLTWQDSLMRAYGMTPEELARGYGRSIGVPSLTP